MNVLLRVVAVALVAAPCFAQDASRLDQIVEAYVHRL